jgi:hypothetical protein
MILTRVLLLFSLLLLLIDTAYATTVKQAVHYTPELVSLSGIVKLCTHKGVSDYEKDNLSEKIMKWGYIKLDNRIKIIPYQGTKNSENMPIKNVNILRLVSDNEKHWEKIKTGNYVRIKGTLSYSSTGIGYPCVWLIIHKIELLGKGHKVGKWHYRDDEQDYIIK